MLPRNSERSDHSSVTISAIFQNIFKTLILLIFPFCLYESSWLVGSHNHQIIYCGLDHTIQESEIIYYDDLCQNSSWACELQTTSYNTKVAMILYYVIYSIYCFFYTLAQVHKRFSIHLSKIPELAISLPLNILLYIALLCYANSIPHKFDNTLVEFDSSFGIAFICCLLHIADVFQCILHTHFTPTQITEYTLSYVQSVKSLCVTSQALFALLTTQVLLNIPLFVKPDNFVLQNVSPLFGISWIFCKSKMMFHTYSYLTIFTIFINTFNISMMKQTKYETTSEILVNVIFVFVFVLHFASLGLLYLIDLSDSNENTQSESHKPSLKTHLHTIQAAKRLSKRHNEDIENFTPTDTAKTFTIS